MILFSIFILFPLIGWLVGSFVGKFIASLIYKSDDSESTEKSESFVIHNHNHITENHLHISNDDLKSTIE